MIQPLKANIIHGIHKAVAIFEDNGVVVKFENSTPNFAKQVGKIVDNFMNNDKIEKTPQGLQQLAQDVFERGSNAVK